MAKTALVTGASTGIGLELARLLAKDGFSLFLTARNAAALDQVASEMRALGSPDAIPVPCDLGKADGARRLAEALGGTTPDVLINNAGFGKVGPFPGDDLGVQMEMIQVNVTALVELTGLLLPAMIRRGSGRILNVASTAAFQPGPLMAIYFATKSFVLHFSEALAEEVRKTGVSVTVLCPGPTDTQFQGRAGAENTKLFKKSKVMSAARVAGIGYRAMMKGKTLTIAGLSNRLGMQALRLAPRSIVRKMVMKLQQN